jgi:MscS family membrane protein
MLFQAFRFAFLVALVAVAGRLPAWQQPQVPAAFNPFPSMEDPLLGRTTPRQMLETFYFSLEGLDHRPELIQTAGRCLDNSLLQAEQQQLHLAAVHLGEILDHFDLPHNILPETTTATETVLFAEGDFRLVIRNIPGDGWRFSAETVKAIPDMRREVFRLKREATMGRPSSNLVDGRRTPEMTLKAFRDAIARRDFVEAATCMDSSAISPRLWVTKGPALARQLAFAFQRSGFLYGAEVPNDPAGSRYTWFASPRGRIALERVAVTESKEAWLFNRATLETLPSLVELVKGQPVDPHWVRLGLDLGPEILRDIEKTRSKKPPEGTRLPAGRESPRALAGTLFRLCEELKAGRKVREELAACLDLGPLSNRLGREISPVRVAINLEAVLRSMDLEIGMISDLWNDEPQTLKGGNQGAEVLLRRMEDGGWKFDYDTLLRLPEMYAKLTATQKTARERYHDFSTPRETYATFEWSLHKGDMDRATECLDLSDFPSAARASLGPRLAWKIRYYLDRNKFIIPQEVPNQPDGRRWGAIRSETGEALFIGRRAADPWKDRWLFTSDSLERIERLFPSAIGTEPVADVAKSYWFREGPDFLECPPVWLHTRMPDLLRTRLWHLEGYQWIGMVVILLGSYTAGWFATLGVNLTGTVLLSRTGVSLPPGMVFNRLRPIRMLVAFGAILWGLDILDLPIAFQKAFLPASKAVAIFLCLWAAYRLADLGLDIHMNRPQVDDKAGLHDLLAPTVASLVKISFILVAGYYLIDLMGDADLLTRILAGLGIVGLAISLAAQDAIKHFFGTLLLISERPFRIGDRIIIDKHRGVVETVGFRSTRIRTDKGTLVILPNSALAEGTVENLGRRDRHFERLALPLEEESSAERREMFISGVKDACKELAPWSRRPATVEWMPAAGEEPPQVRVSAWLPGWGGKAARDARQLLLERIALLASVHGIDFADRVLPSLPGETMRLPARKNRSA